MRFNIRFFYELLQILESELNGQRGLSSKVHRVIPWIRHYSAWLLSQSAILAGGTPESSLNLHITNLGSLYARSLNLLRSSFSVTDLPEIEYLLEEDGDAVGFAPLESSGCDRIKQRYYRNGLRKPHWYDKRIKQQQSRDEMFSRIQDIIADGAYLVTQEVVLKSKMPLCNLLTIL